MKTVQKVCLVCRGIGYASWINTTVNATENTVSATSKICPHCGGKCLCEVPMTNADRIRAMDDKEISVLLSAVKFRRECFIKIPDFLSIQDAYKWLQQPAEEADHESNSEP